MLEIGASASIRKAFTEEEVIRLADLSLGRNPLYLDNEFGTPSILGERVVHGILVASLLSVLIGMKLPGKGSIYLWQRH